MLNCIAFLHWSSKDTCPDVDACLYLRVDIEVKSNAKQETIVTLEEKYPAWNLTSTFDSLAHPERVTAVDCCFQVLDDYIGEATTSPPLLGKVGRIISHFPSFPLFHFPTFGAAIIKSITFQAHFFLWKRVPSRNVRSHGLSRGSNVTCQAKIYVIFPLSH
jgi:hypothetical protein